MNALETAIERQLQNIRNDLQKLNEFSNTLDKAGLVFTSEKINRIEWNIKHAVDELDALLDGVKFDQA